MPFAKPSADKAKLEQGTELTPNFDKNGLIAAIAQEASSGDILMFAWMNAAALEATIATGEATFFSRSRNRLWKKGEESGNVLRIVDIRIDCDQDVVLLRVKTAGQGVACHTGAKSCFYRKLQISGGGVELIKV
ncbi:MAG: hypothetical protein RL291_903 [Pseudomonadota bacterium]